MEASTQARRATLRRLPRIGPANAVLLAIAVLMVVATAHQVAGQYRERQRLERADHAFSAWNAAHGRGAFGTMSLVRSVDQLDVVCANRIAAGRPVYRLCLLATRTGPYARRVAGGYRRPAGSPDAFRYRYGCFGRAVDLRQCPGA